MTKKFRALCASAIICVIGAAACFSGYAAELINLPSGEDPNAVAAEPAAPITEPVTPGYTEPVAPTEPVIEPTPAPADPGYTEPVEPVTPSYTESVPSVYEPVDPGYTDPGYVDPGYTDPNYGSTTTAVASEYTYQPENYNNYSYYDTNSFYMDYNSQYTQYIENTYQAQYDDNYYYVPSYTAPEESLIETSSKEVNEEELTNDDWHKIMLDLSDGNVKEGNTKTFNFIKNNDQEGDSSVEWMLYVGVVLILMSVLTISFVVITTNKANEKELTVV